MPSPRIRRLKRAAKLAAQKNANGQEEVIPKVTEEESVVEATEEEVIVEKKAAPKKVAPKKATAKKSAFNFKKLEVKDED